MNSANEQLREPILRAVSRSFYLSIRLLPAKLRDPIALAYLLARATDTIADTAEIDTSFRLEELARLAGLIQSANLPEEFPEFAAKQSNAAERRLIQSVPQCLAWLRALAPQDQAEIRAVLLRINEGQALDVRHFGSRGEVVALAGVADLERYIYLVAGCVGEFWTNICASHLPRFSAKSQAEMVSLGVEYGKGLQLINILRDVGPDLAAGRCYLPAEEIRLLGLEPSELRDNVARVQPVIDRWRERAEQGIAAGIEYSCAIRPFRIRLATVLPALIGARTLHLLREAGPEVFSRKVKIRRAEVRGLLIKMLATGASPRAIRAAFAAR